VPNGEDIVKVEDATMTLAQELENLEQMRNRGALSEDEFAQAKARLLQPAPQPAAAPRINATSFNGLRRSRSDQWIGGVCGGLAQFTGIDAWLWRLLFALMLICAGTGLLLYVLMWILVPQEPNTTYRIPASTNP
jgi:phage shock protein PspC (stress-responsive transcriptional regulator)